MTDFKRIKCICFAGGGVRGLSHIGVLEALETTTDFSLKNVVKCTGTSIGSLVALAVSLKYNIQEIKLIIDKLYFPKLLSMSFFNLSHWGLDNGKNMMKFIEGILYTKTGIKDPTFKQLFDITGVTLQVIGTNVTKNKEVCFSHLITPNMTVAKATMISMSLPILFRPIEHGGDLFTDGSIVNNRPFQPKYYEGIPWNECIFLEIDWPETKITSFNSFICRILYSLIKAQSTENYDQIKQNVIVSIVPYSTVNFHLSQSTKQKIIQCGYLSVNYFIMRFNQKEIL